MIENYFLKYSYINPIFTKFLENFQLENKIIEQPAYDLIKNFPIFCYNYHNFFRSIFFKFDKNGELLNSFNNNIGISNEMSENILKYTKIELNLIEEMFKKLAIEEKVHKEKYKDEEKIIFYLNFFNLKILHEVFFSYYIKNKKLPKNNNEWRIFLNKISFKLFGLDLNLWNFEISIIR